MVVHPAVFQQRGEDVEVVGQVTDRALKHEAVTVLDDGLVGEPDPQHQPRRVTNQRRGGQRLAGQCDQVLSGMYLGDGGERGASTVGAKPARIS